MDEPGPAVAGLREGDLVIEYGGRTVSGIDELHIILTEEAVWQRQKTVALHGMRKSEYEIIPLERK